MRSASEAHDGSPAEQVAGALAEELARLRVLACELAAGVDAEPGPWQALVPEPDADALALDNAIQRAHGELRGLFLRAVHASTSRRWLTPPTGQAIRFPGSELRYEYAYDRQHPPLALEARLASEQDAGRVAGGLVCSSGMAALQVALQALGFLLGDARPAVGVLGSYFETLTLLRLSPFAGRWQRVLRSDALAEAIRAGRYGVVLVEPVQYDWQLGVVDWERLIAAIDDSDAPPVVVVDTTLSGVSREWEAVRRALIRSRAPLLVCVRSGLKLDQEGLELSNLGVVEAWAQAGHERLAGFCKVAAACRVATGATLGWPEACALSPAFVLDRGRLEAHSARVFRSNEALFRGVPRSGALFQGAVYPARPWGAPFVLFQLREGDAAAYQRLAALLRDEAARRSLDWTMSGSFGFRTERFETILPTEQQRPGEAPTGVLKVAAGCYRGERLRQIALLLAELAAFDSLDEAGRAWSRTTIAVPS